MLLTPENVETLSTEDLSEIVWEMYKDIHGVRPRFMSGREEYLSFLKRELQPEMLAIRQADREAEEAYWNQLDAEEARMEQMTLDIEVGYPGEKYEHLDPL
jgi:hypothetical protein